MKPTQPRSRHGLTAPMARIKLKAFQAIDRRTVAARETLAFKGELAAALGGEADLSPQRRKLVDMTARAALLLDHVDAYLFEQRSLVNARAKRSEEHTSELQSRLHLVCRLLLEKKKKQKTKTRQYVLVTNTTTVPRTAHLGVRPA